MISFLQILVLCYLIFINIFTIVVFAIDAVKHRHWSSKTYMGKMIMLCIIGGALGGCIGNYLFDTAIHRTNHTDSNVLEWFPALILFVELIAYFILSGDQIILILINRFHSRLGALAIYLIIVNVVGFFMFFIKVAERYYRPHIKGESTNVPVIIVMLIGGSVGMLISKVLFNFKYRNPCNYPKRWVVRIYGPGVYILAIVEIVWVVSMMR